MILLSLMALSAHATLVPVIREHVECALLNLKVLEEDIYRAEVVVTEACSNVIRHAYDTPGNVFHVQLCLSSKALEIMVSDTGQGFDPKAIPIPEVGQIGGYGIHFIRTHSDHVIFEPREPCGTCLTARINLRYESEEASRAAGDLDQAAQTLIQPTSSCN